MLAKIRRPEGFPGFVVMWIGIVITNMGTFATRFALLIWLWDQTGQATSVALFLFAGYALYMLIAPAAGAIVDRSDKRLILILNDTGQALLTGSLLVLYLTGHLQVWQVYAAQALVGGFEAFMVPARTAAISILVPREQLSRAAGMRSMAYHAGNIGGPVAGGLLLAWGGLPAVMGFDLITFALAVICLLIPAIPLVIDRTPREGKGWRGALADLSFGLRYIGARRGLLGLTLIFVVINAAGALTYFALIGPMVLARGGDGEASLALVQTLMGIGGALGALFMTIWGGGKRQALFLIAGVVLTFLLGDYVIALGRTVVWWAAGCFFAALFIPPISAANDAIWQVKVPVEQQGRVIGARQWISEGGMAPMYLLAGPLADRLMEPAMMPGGWLTPWLGPLVGVGPGAGMAALFLLTGTIGVLTGVIAWFSPAVRKVELDLPDRV